MIALVYVFKNGQETGDLPYKYEYNDIVELQQHCYDLLTKSPDVIECNAFDSGMNKMLFNGIKSQKQKTR